jgi:hypothetical protein
VTSRRLRPVELQLLMADLKSYLEHFRRNPQAAGRLLAVGDRQSDPSLDAARLAAFTLIANTIFNLDEAIMEN